MITQKKFINLNPLFKKIIKIKLYETINNKKTNSSNNYIVRGDFLETGIEICNNEFLNIISENFELKSIIIRLKIF